VDSCLSALRAHPEKISVRYIELVMVMDYCNKETKMYAGGKIVRKVIIKDGKGHKSVTQYARGRKVSTVKKPLSRSHIVLIQTGKFIPGLFNDCVKCRQTRKNRK
jgi:hypothetical protein